MRPSTYRSGRRLADRDSCWRRRFFTLGGGLAVLAVLAWLFTGARPERLPAAGAATAARSSAAAAQAPGALPPAAYGSPWAPPTPRPSATVTVTAANAGRCAPGDVVLSLFPAQPAGSQPAQPAFGAFAASRRC